MKKGPAGKNLLNRRLIDSIDFAVNYSSFLELKLGPRLGTLHDVFIFYVFVVTFKNVDVFTVLLVFSTQLGTISNVYIM